ncbi:Uncharacterized protein dnm_048920 [Desulfonema magnum]|uniref:Uncharacterized protein n=1 Tax=Desulfonema magnum TaxID=45655 RepID=A0A975GPJ0_9BACT|nr:Uncharacterized protein dnm_048920 [Desulfonema magnum]
MIIEYDKFFHLINFFLIITKSQADPKCKNYIFAIALQLRRSIFRTPERTPESPLTLNSTALPGNAPWGWHIIIFLGCISA